MRSESSDIEPPFVERSRPPNAIRVVTARGFEDLRPHLAAWDDLAWNAPHRNPTLLPQWVDAYFQHRLGPEEGWLCSFAYRGERLIGVLPLVVTSHRTFGKSLSVLRTPFDALTPSGDIVLAQDQASGALEALLTEARRQAPGHLGVDFRAVRRNSPLRAALQAGVNGYLVRSGKCPRYSLLNVAEGAETYFHGLRKLKGNLRRFRRKLEARGQVSVEMLRGADAKVEFLSEYLALEASGWKGRNGTAMGDDPRVANFYKTLIENLSAKGRWEWHVLRVDGRVIAAEMGARCGSTLMLPKYSFDEEFADCGPGNLLTWEVVRNGFMREEIEELNQMSSAETDRLWHMDSEVWTDFHLVRRSAAALVLQLPRAEAASFYQKVVRPRIPLSLRAAYRTYRRRGDRKPRRAAEGRLREDGGGGDSGR